MKVSRRSLLKAGSAFALFPWVRDALAQVAPAPKLVLLMQSSGTQQQSFWPRAGFTASPILAPIFANEELKSRTTAIRGLFNHGGGAGNEHDQGFAGLWTGRAPRGTFTEPWGDGPSIDQQLKKALTFSEPYPTLNTAVLASTSPLFKPHRYSFSYVGARQQVPAQIDPWKLYAAMFAPTLGGKDAQQRLLQKKTVLDFVRADLKSLKPGLPAAERAKLEAHETALREMEHRLELSLVERSGDACRRPAVPSERVDLLTETNVPVLAGLMFDFITLALGCGLTRIVNFQWGQSGDRWRFNWLGLDENSHDDIFHRDNGSDPGVTEKSLRIHKWYGDQVASLLTRMHAFKGANGSLLDESLVVWGNEMATGPHGMDQIPIVMFGSAGGRLATGRVVDRGPQTYHRLGTSVLNLFGVKADGFGEQPTCGPISGLA